MFDIASIKASQKKTKPYKSSDTFESLLSMAISDLKNFSQTEDETTLKKAADGFFEALKLNRLRVEPYFYLSYIYCLFEDKEQSVYYFNLAEGINPHYPGLAKVRNIIF